MHLHIDYMLEDPDNLSNDNLFPPMTHTFAQLDYVNVTFQTLAVKESMRGSVSRDFFSKSVVHDAKKMRLI